MLIFHIHQKDYCHQLGTYININAAKQRYEIDKETGKINPDKIRPPSQGGKV